MPIEDDVIENVAAVGDDVARPAAFAAGVHRGAAGRRYCTRNRTPQPSVSVWEHAVRQSRDNVVGQARSGSPRLASFLPAVVGAVGSRVVGIRLVPLQTSPGPPPPTAVAVVCTQMGGYMYSYALYILNNV